MATTDARPTQEFVEMQSIERGVVFLKNGSLRKILIVSGLNFDLKSEEEQQIILGAYQNLLNGLKFSLQFFIHSRRLNIETYLSALQERLSGETNELLRNQIVEYIQFVRLFVEKNPIMTKAFFVVVPFDPIIVPGALSSGKALFGFFGKSTSTAEEASAPHAREAHIEQLEQRVSQVVSLLGQIGLRAIPLQEEEITDLFYNLYNPEARERKAKAPEEHETKKT